MVKNYYFKSLLITCVFCILHFYSFSKTIEVDSQQSFNNAISRAVPGDVIVWFPGVYSDVVMKIPKNKLTVRAKVSGKTVFTGASRVVISGDNVVFEGFQYLSGKLDRKNVIDISGSFNRVMHVNISGYVSWKYLVIEESSIGTTISNCNFENRLNLDDKNILSILVNENQPGRHKVQYCSFQNFKGEGRDMGIEPVRIGVSTQKEFSSQSVIEYCYFTKCSGDGEIISNKSADNVIRYNTFENNPHSEVVLRHGDGASVYGNFFLNGKGGVRVKEGRNHSIFNNYFSGLKDTSIYLQNTAADPVRNVSIIHNTFVNTAKVRLDGAGDNPPKGISVFNNLFSNQKLNILSHATGSEQWGGNFYSGNLGMKPIGGLSQINLLLEENQFGFYQLSFRSPLINKSEAGYPLITAVQGLGVDVDIMLDITKTSRPKEEDKKDVGCYEFFISSKIKTHASLKNTGPSYL